MSGQENFNSSNSSLELVYLPNYKSKYKNSCSKNIRSNVLFDQINTTNNSYSDFKNFNLKKTSTNTSLNNSITVKLDNNINSNSNKSCKFYDLISDSQDSQNFDKTFSLHDNNNINSTSYNEQNELSEFQNNFITPRKNCIQPDHITESAKLLDRIYGKEWRNIDGLIKNELRDDLFGNDAECYKENISTPNHNGTENSLSYTKTKNNKYCQKKIIQIEMDNTSTILENLNLTENQLNKNTTDNQKIKSENSSNFFSNECNNDLKKINISKTLKKESEKKKDLDLNHQLKIPIKSNSEAKLSFLSSLSCFTGSMKCDPKAEKYKLKFKKNKDDLVSVLFKLFNEEVFSNKLPNDMNFKWNARLRSTAGACFNKRSVKINENLMCERVSRIELSSKIIDTAERLRDTLIHELCHAASWIFNGISEGHGPSWKSWANKAMQKFPELPIIKRCHSYDIQTKFTYKCIKCGYSFGRHSKSLNLKRKRCGYCYGEFELLVNKINNPAVQNNLPLDYTDPLRELYKLNDEQQKSKLPKKPSKFALFVKDNYGRVKKENAILRHGEIMKLLGSQYSKTKMLTPDEIFDKLLDS